MKFGANYFLYGLFLLPALWVFYKWAEKKKQKAKARFGNLELICKLEESHSVQKYNLKKYLLILSVFFLILALARPQWGTRLVTMTREGIDILIAIDVSASMSATDIRPNRLSKAKQEVNGLLDKLKGDRVGIVVFAGSAFIFCPLTMDYKAAQMFLDNVDIGVVPKPGTAIGEAMRTSILGFNQKEKKHKVLILLTDGEDTGESDPLGAAEEATKEGIKIYTIGVGTEAGEPIPIQNEGGLLGGFKKDEQGNVVLSRLDQGTLQEIALKTGGKYYQATTGEMELDQIYNEVSGMEKKELQGNLMIQYEERYQFFLFLGLILLIAEFFISDRRKIIPRMPITIGNLAKVGATTLLFLLALGGLAWGDPYSSLNNKGNQMYKKGDFQKALDFYNQAGIEKPDSPEIRYNLGNSLHQQKQWEGALQNYQKSLQGTPDMNQAQIYYNLGNTFYRLDKYPEAIEAYKKCLEINPNDEDAKYNLEYTKKKLQEKKNQQKQPQSKNQQNKDKPKQNQQAQAPDDKNQKKNPQNREEQKQNPQPPEQQNQQQLAQKPPGGMSKEEADRILDALQDKERDNKKKNRKIFKTPKSFTGKDW
ncbi:MAG: BatB protein [candidate division Zixibacteria bacterium RBG-1]|nr:MAG: BatB protein [candidate division Zixibacteria bacterium RBG-1]OGC85374.1 MAG: hypothetical protein A2V73_09180 [candidate division Zixibacteria bacterium RBG_19FT_COMBO_42_43]